MALLPVPVRDALPCACDITRALGQFAQNFAGPRAGWRSERSQGSGSSFISLTSARRAVTPPAFAHSRRKRTARPRRAHCCISGKIGRLFSPADTDTASSRSRTRTKTHLGPGSGRRIAQAGPEPAGRQGAPVRDFFCTLDLSPRRRLQGLGLVREPSDIEVPSHPESVASIPLPRRAGMRCIVPRSRARPAREGAAVQNGSEGRGRVVDPSACVPAAPLAAGGEQRCGGQHTGGTGRRHASGRGQGPRRRRVANGRDSAGRPASESAACSGAMGSSSEQRAARLLPRR